MGKASEQLIRDARRGKEKALLRLFDEHHAPLFRFAWRLTGSVADAEDIVQECFLTLLRPDCGFDPARTSVRTYHLRCCPQPVSEAPAAKGGAPAATIAGYRL